MLSFDALEPLVLGRGRLRLVATDGLPAAGKSTLARRLVEATGGACVQLDELVKPEALWPWRGRPSFPFGCIRYDSFLAAVQKLAAHGRWRYRPYNWDSGALADMERVVEIARLVFVEGVTVLHWDPTALYDLRIWVDSDGTTVLQAVRAPGHGRLGTGVGADVPAERGAVSSDQALGAGECPGRGAWCSGRRPRWTLRPPVPCSTRPGLRSIRARPPSRGVPIAGR